MIPEMFGENCILLFHNAETEWSSINIFIGKKIHFAILLKIKLAMIIKPGIAFLRVTALKTIRGFVSDSSNVNYTKYGL